MKKSRGFTLIEMLVVFAAAFFLSVGVGCITAVFGGNFWFTDESVLRELQVDRPNIARMLKTERNIFSNSVILVEDRDGSRSTFCLDTNMLWNYRFSACKE